MSLKGCLLASLAGLIAQAAARADAARGSVPENKARGVAVVEYERLKAEGGLFGSISPAPVSARRLAGADLATSLQGCRAHPGRRLWDSPACFLDARKASESAASEGSGGRLLKHAVFTNAPLRFAVRGPATAAEAAEVSVDVRAGGVTISARSRHGDAARAQVQQNAKGDGFVVVLPHVLGMESQEWEVEVAAGPEAGAEQATAGSRQAIAAAKAADAAAAGEAAEAGELPHAAVVDVAYSLTSGGAAAGRSLQAPSGTPTPLTDGTQVAGYLAKGAWAYYSFTQPAPLTQRTDIVLTSISGDADLYVTLSGQTPTRTIYQYYSSAVTGADSVAVKPNDTFVNQYCSGSSGASCPILIAVYGWLASNYTIAATTAAGATTLTPGLPFQDTIPTAWDYNYYVFQAGIDTARITIAVTPLSGDPDIWVSNSAFVANGTGSKRPTAADASSYCAYSNLNRRDVIELYPGDACYCAPPCTYYIGVQAWADPVSYSIVASELANPFFTLIDGLPMAGLLPQGETDQFVFNVQFPPDDPTLPPTRRVIEIIMQTYLGDADLFVTLDGRVPSATSWDYRAIGGTGVDAIAIRASDPAFLASPCGPAVSSNGSCAISIAAYAFESSIYAIVATSGRYLQLVDGQPQTDSVDTRQYNYYRFFVGAPGQLITFQVQPASGDPDLYCGSDANANTTVPTTARGTYLWRSITTGNEMLQVYPTDPGACAPPCSYYCAVYGYRTNASYVITAATGSAAPTRLIIGQPQADVVADQTYKRYTADFNASALTITVTPTSGDPDLLVRLDNTLVTLDNAQYSSTTAMQGVDEVTITPTDAAYIANCSSGSGGSSGVGASCEANIAVFGWGQAEYVITASIDQSVLFDGVPAYGSVGAQRYSYFRYTAFNSLPVTISVTALSGDPDLYVSSLTPTPNVTSRQWYSNGLGTEVVYIDFSDPRLAACGLPCTLYIGVHGFFSSATFTVSATASTINTLLPGLPLSGTAAAWAFTYYTFVVPPVSAGQARQPIEFSATPISGGDISLYVNNVFDNRTGDVKLPTLSCSPSTCAIWTVNDAVWSSFNSPSRERVTIAPSDAGWAPGKYVVGVLALGQDATFAITGILAGGIVTLQDGIPYEDVAPAGTYNYYRLLVDLWGADVAISVTPVAGDPDLFVSFHAGNMFPNRSRYDRMSTSARNAEAVYIPWRSLTECQAQILPGGAGGDCDIWIGVLGFTNTTYTVTASVVNGTQRTMLLDGVPASGTVAFRSYVYYYADVAVLPGQTYSVYVRSIAGDADVYVRLDGQNPSTSFFQYASTLMAGDEIINITPASRFYNNTATMAIAVYGYSNATYSITYATSSAVVQLANGIAQSGIVAGLGAYYTYYYVSVDGPGADVTLSLTALAGDPDMFVDVWKSPSYRPSVTSWKWAGTYFGSDAVYIAGLTDVNACPGACNYIVAVMCAVGISCRYTMTATVSPFTTIPLVDGQPLSSAQAQGGYKYFTFETGMDPKSLNVSFAAVSVTGNVQLYVTNTYAPGDGGFGGLPTNAAGNYIWSSATGGTSTGSGIVDIPFTDPSVASNASVYTIGAFCVAGPCAFTMTAATATVPQTLLPGQPSQQMDVGAGSSQSFNMAVTDTSKDLIAVATAFDGSVFVAVSYGSAPVCYESPPGTVLCNATWVGAAGSTPSQVRISADAPCSGPYVVGPCNATMDWQPGQFQIVVYALSSAPASYSLTAYLSQATLRLLDGQPQAGQTVQSQPPVYTFQTDYDPSLPDIRISVVAGAVPLNVYVTSCYDTQCTPAMSLPGPTQYEAVASIDATTAWDFFITKYLPAYCTDPTAGGTCNYFVSLYPATPCDVPSCTAPFTLVAQEQGGSLTRITFFSVNQKMLLQPGSVLPGRSAGYEMYLQPQTRPLEVTLRLESCGPGFPTLYVCNPSAGAATKCANPFQPSATDNSASAGTQAAGFATLRVSQVTASNLFVAVAADSSAGPSDDDPATPSRGLVAAGQSGPSSWGFSLGLAVSPVLVLWAPTAAGLTVQPAGTSVTVSWAPATIGSATAPGSEPARGVQYVLYAAPGSFAQSGAALATTVVPSTPCGLIRWASIATAVEPPVAVANATTAVLTNLQPNQPYEFNVVAVCDRFCWALNALAPDAAELEAAAAERLAAAAAMPAGLFAGAAAAGPGQFEAGVSGARAVAVAAGVVGLPSLAQLGAPGYDVQRVAYTVTPGNTGSAGSPPTKGAFPVAGIVGIVVGVLALGAGCLLWVRYRRRRVGDAAYQYNTLDVSGAMDTISTPAAGYVRSGGGLLSSLRDMLSSRGRGGGGGAGSSSYARSGVSLADSSYSELDERAAAYL